MSKRKPTRPQQTPARSPGSRLSPPINFGDRVPMIVTLGSDLEESRRLAAALQKLREAAHG